MILVTGGTGLVGSHLLYSLAAADKSIIAIHRKGSDLIAVKRVFKYYSQEFDALFSKITWFEADITDIPSLQRVFENDLTEVYHCAALISFDPKDYYSLRKVNIHGTANLVNLSLKKGVKKFCFVSSIATLDEAPGQPYITEESEWNPELKHHGYAITKYGAEMEVWRASQEGLDVVIVNPGVILGAGMWNTGSGKLFSSVANGFKYYTEGVTGFVSVEDVVKSMIELMEASLTNERFVLVAENASFKSVLHLIAQELKVKKPSVKATKLMTEIAWRVDSIISSLTGKKRRFTKNAARSGHHRSYYSSGKLEQALNFEFATLSASIARVSKIYNNEIGLNS